MAALSTSFSKPKEGPVTQSMSAHADLTRRGEDANDQSVCGSLHVPPKHSTKKSTSNSPSLQSRSAGSQKLKGMKEGANKGISQSRTALPHGPAGVNSLGNAQQNVRKSADKKRRQVDDVNMDVDKVGDTNSGARGENSVSVGVRPSARVGKAVMKKKQSEGIHTDSGEELLASEGDGVFAGWSLGVSGGVLDGGGVGGVTREMLGQYGSDGEVGGVSGDIEMASGVGDLEDRGRGDGLLESVESVLAAIVPIEGLVLAGEFVERVRDFGKVANERAVIVGKAEEGTELEEGLGHGVLDEGCDL
ncbi:hypothetical protein CBR_g21219 [Chara braunii]|uniref:Uncharacterized protein n=1 Tax=Chara braunii TaxID=69332 RepID=A0A388L103_CHABU|nr:hypothetical protein CBR_g21219 [Chara braunii]|eukprot:GBG75977.1 hypothetical protein CBR_g21219 [Chara braunii]